MEEILQSNGLFVFSGIFLKMYSCTLKNFIFHKVVLIWRFWPLAVLFTRGCHRNVSQRGWFRYATRCLHSFDVNFALSIN